MQSVWIEIQCSKCGAMDKKRYIVKSLSCLDEFKIKCQSCNCEHLEMMEITDMLVERAEHIVLVE